MLPLPNACLGGINAGPQPAGTLDELPPITPLAAAGEDATFVRRDRPAAAGPRTTATTAAAPSTTAAAGGAGGGSLLDVLLASALQELPSVQVGPGAHQLPAMLPPAPAQAPPAGRAAVRPALPHALVCPGAPRRIRELPPPPEVPAEILAGLRPPGWLAGSPALSRASSSGLSSASMHTAFADGFGSFGGVGSRVQGQHPALQQACAFLDAAAAAGRGRFDLR